MKKYSLYLFISLIIIVFSVLLIFIYVNPTINIQKRKNLCYKFLLSKMTEPNGAVVRRIPVNNDQIKSNSLLSESVGLLMLYCVKINDFDQFEKQYGLVKNLFMVHQGLLTWKIHIPSLEKEPCNASLDDLRIAQALALGYQKWGPKRYLDLALDLSMNIKRKNLVNNLLVEGYCWGEQEKPVKTVDISYLDLSAMKMLSQYDPSWHETFDKSKQLIMNARLPGGFFMDKYNIAEKTFYNREKNLINNLICAIHLARRNLSDKKLYKFLKKEWETKQKIFGRYDPETLKPIVEYESIAVYALTLRLSLVEKDKDFAYILYKKITQYQIMDKNSAFYGAFANSEAHSFDTLQVLLALNELKNY